MRLDSLFRLCSPAVLGAYKPTQDDYGLDPSDSFYTGAVGVDMQTLQDNIADDAF